MSPAVRLVVPRRPDGGRRDRLWEFCEAWWSERFPEWELVVSDSDPDRPFNRGQAINRGSLGHWDVLVALDGDVVADAEQVAAAVALAADSGRLTLAYDEYAALDRQMSDKVLAGHSGRWTHRPSPVARSHVSSIVAIPRPLWSAIDGFDPRCEGWGFDDTILAHTARVLGGGIERVPGKVYHLWHPPSAHAKPDDPHRQAAALLANRYFAELDPIRMFTLVAERTAGDVAVVIPTDGRRETIEDTFDSALEHLGGLKVASWWISDDSGDIDYQAWLRRTFGHLATTITTPRRTGYAAAMQRAREVAIAAGAPYIFWLEDDFILNEPIDLSAMAAILTRRPELTQVMLRRQPWFPAEIAAGGYVELNPDAYDEHADGDLVWLEHSLGHWMNPHLTTRDFLIEHPWPKGANSEAAFGKALARKGRRFAILGGLDDPPKVRHIGERVGAGY